MDKPRILIFSIAYEPLVGGAELAIRYITDRIFDYEFDLITVRFDRAHPKQEKIGNVNVYRVGFGSRLGRLLYPAFALRLAKKLHSKQNYQITWAIMAAYASAAALMFQRRFPTVKFLLTLQEGDTIEHIHSRVKGFKKVWQQSFKKADYIQVISKFLAQWAVKEGATCPVEVVPNGGDLEKFKIQNSNVKIANQNSKFTIITASRLVHKNGIDILIHAVSKLQTSNFQLQILGAGPEEARLKKLAADLKIADRIEFLGNISQEELPKYLSESDIFVRPSRSEGLGTAFLEAMAAGLPIIGTPVGGIPDFLHPHLTSPLKGEKNAEKSGIIPLPRGEGEPNGLFCKAYDPADLAEKIKILMQDSDLRKKLGQNGKRLVEEQYSWDIVDGKMKGIFSKILYFKL